MNGKRQNFRICQTPAEFKVAGLSGEPHPPKALLLTFSSSDSCKRPMRGVIMAILHVGTLMLKNMTCPKLSIKQAVEKELILALLIVTPVLQAVKF